MIVVDAGSVFEYVLWRGYGEPVAEAFDSNADGVFAPELLDLEVLQAVRRGERKTPAGAVSAVVDALGELPVLRVGHERLVERIWELRHVCSAYDAAYVALAERLGDGTILLTTDRRLCRAVDRLGTIDVAVVPVP